VRLGIYTDLVYRTDGSGLSTDRAFVIFLTALGERCDELVLFGRLDPSPGRAPYAVAGRTRFVALPHYPRVRSVGALLRGIVRARRAFAAELERLDAVWLFGPHPIAFAFARAARDRHVPVFLGVRQDFPRYVGRRLPSRRWLWAVPAAHALERSFRRLARRVPTVVVGEALAQRYAGASGRLHVTGISLVPRASVVTAEEAVGRDWSGILTVLSVGRLDSEKNPLLLPEILVRLRRASPQWRLVVAGEGPLASAVAARAAERGVADALELRGYVPHDAGLLHLYRNSHVFLHVSLTEGLPQVLFEALAAGLPVVGTDVGGVGAALAHGARGLLLPPGDAVAAARACERLRREPELREALVRRGLRYARSESIESQLDRLATFFDGQLAGR
jgi:glycosyltransferase involved in cell wall biosynthesis